VLNKLRRFVEIARDDGPASAVRETYSFLGSKLNSWYKRHVFRVRWLRNGGSWNVTKEINGSMMSLNFHPDNPQRIERSLALNGTREPEVTRVFKQVLERLGSEHDEVHVFDVGANIGYYTLLEARVLDDAKIYAVEAEPENARQLRKNVELNGYGNVEVLPHAAGAERTTKELALRSASNIHRISDVLGDSDRQGTVDVEVYPIDRLVAERNIPDDALVVVRMDVEGYELPVLQGMKELLASERPMYVSVELHVSRLHLPKIDPDEVIDILERNGFSPEYISTDGGETCDELDDFGEAREIESNGHLLASRL